MEETAGYHRATFAVGCFWDLEAAFRRIDGVIETVAGYTGGSVPDPGYEQVDSGTTGHVQAVGIVYDPNVISYEALLELFFSIHDPSQAGGQGDYAGSQYRPVIFWHDEKQQRAALEARNRLAWEDRFSGREVLTAIEPAGPFYPAEECHQRFYEKCGQGYGVSRQVDE